MEKTKILIYGMTPNIGGLETYIMEQYRHFDKSKFHLDFINTDKKHNIAFADEILANGSKIYNLFSYSNWKKFLISNKGEYDLIIFNTVNHFILYMLEMVKRIWKCPIVIHSHNAGIDTANIVKKISIPIFKLEQWRFKRLGAKLWACSDLAGLWMFGKKLQFTVIKNGIETSKFKFDEQIRNEKRAELGLSDSDFVIGHIGRFAPQKNHEYLIKIFAEVVKKIPNAKLLLVGQEVPLGCGNVDKIKTLASKLNLSDKIKFLGLRKDTDKLYQAFDIFILPSLYEGLPIVGVEAQTSGLPCYFSDRITKEAKLIEDVSYLPIDSDNDISKWVDSIALANIDDLEDRKKAVDLVIEKGFDILTETNKVEKLISTILEAQN